MPHPSQLNRVVLTLVLVAAGLVPAARANVTVILKTGGRIEAKTAYETPTGWQLELPSGGTLDLRAENVKRVSNMASDLPRNRTVAFAMSPSETHGSVASPDSVVMEPKAPMVARYPVSPELVRIPRGTTLTAGAAEMAPQGIRPTSEQSGARQAADRAASTNPLTGGFQRYSSGQATGPQPTLRDRSQAMPRAFARPIR